MQVLGKNNSRMNRTNKRLAMRKAPLTVIKHRNVGCSLHWLFNAMAPRSLPRLRGPTLLEDALAQTFHFSPRALNVFEQVRGHCNRSVLIG